MNDFAHYVRVAGRFTYGSDEHIVALLHDAIEDHLVTHGTIERIYGNRIATYVQFMARRSDETYTQYIQRIKSEELATEVKIADLEDNLRRMDSAHESLRPRYEKALLDLRVSRHMYTGLVQTPDDDAT